MSNSLAPYTCEIRCPRHGGRLRIPNCLIFARTRCPLCQHEFFCFEDVLSGIDPDLIRSATLDPGDKLHVDGLVINQSVVEMARTLARESLENEMPNHSIPDNSMPILGDALLEAGCTNDLVLKHCQQEVHHRDCWVLRAIKFAHKQQTR